MNITLFGGTGPAGRLTVEQALAAGHRVTVYARNPAKLTLQHPNLTVVRGELSEAATIEQVVQGADAVISLLGPAAPDKRLPVSTGMAHITAAMRRHGVRRLVATVSSSYRDPRDKFQFWFDFGVVLLRLLAGSVLRDLEATGRLVAGSGLDWTLIRLPKLRSAPAAGHLRFGYTGTGQVSFFSLTRADLAALLVRQLADRAYLHQAPVVSN